MDYDLISPESPTGFSTNKLPALPIQIYKCTYCGKEEFAENWKYISHYPHCPNCGKMLKSVYVSDSRDSEAASLPEPKPCPCCGSNDVITRFKHLNSNTYSFKVRCCNENCGISLCGETVLLDTSFEQLLQYCEEIVNKWNTRP